MTSSQSQQNGSSVSNSFSENCSLYVENISSDASTKLLSDHVKQSFPDDFKSCEIIKDQKKFNTYFGYITMNTHKSADEVIKQLNGSELCGKQLRIAWNIIDSKNRGSNDSNLYVKSIRKDLSFTDFDKAFREFGDLLSTKLSTNNRGESNGYGYIRYLNSDDAKKVLEDKSIHEQLKKQIGDENFIIEKYQKPENTSKTNIYIDNIDKDCTEDDFLTVIHSYGQILQAQRTMYVFVYDENHECYKAFVNFTNVENAKKAVEELNNSTKFGKNIIRATFFKSKQERQKERVAIRNKILKDYPKSNLCIVTHITPITEQIIREKLGSCGEIYSIFIKAVEKKSTDIAYVCFTSEQSAQNAITESEKLGWEATIYRSKTQNYPGYPYLFSQFYPYMQSDFLFDRQKSNNVQTPLSVNMPFVHLPFSFPTYPQQHNKTTKKSKKGKSKKSANSFVEQKVEQKVVTKEMSEDLGNNLYDYISEKLHFDEDTSARITGVLLESLNYYDLKERLETDQESLKKTIVLVGEELKKQE